MVALELEAGPELDVAIFHLLCGLVEPGEGVLLGDYSTDLNAAFAAAERVGLFDGMAHRIDFRFLAKSDKGPGYAVYEVESDYYDGISFSTIVESRAPTPALAICRAILALHGGARLTTDPESA